MSQEAGAVPTLAGSQNSGSGVDEAAHLTDESAIERPALGWLGGGEQSDVPWVYQDAEGISTNGETPYC